MLLSLTVELELPSVANLREHWTKRKSRTSLHRMVARTYLVASLGTHGLEAEDLLELGVVITLVRRSPRELDDDNLRSALKAFRDGVADAMGVDDRDPRITWAYAQEKISKAHEVRLSIRERT